MELLKEIKNLLHGKDDLQNSLDRIIKDNKYSTKDIALFQPMEKVLCTQKSVSIMLWYRYDLDEFLDIFKDKKIEIKTKKFDGFPYNQRAINQSVTRNLNLLIKGISNHSKFWLKFDYILM